MDDGINPWTWKAVRAYNDDKWIPPVVVGVLDRLVDAKGHVLKPYRGVQAILDRRDGALGGAERPFVAVALRRLNMLQWLWVGFCQSLMETGVSRSRSWAMRNCPPFGAVWERGQSGNKFLCRSKACPWCWMRWVTTLKRRVIDAWPAGHRAWGLELHRVPADGCPSSELVREVADQLRQTVLRRCKREAKQRDTNIGFTCQCVHPFINKDGKLRWEIIFAVVYHTKLSVKNFGETTLRVGGTDMLLLTTRQSGQVKDLPDVVDKFCLPPVPLLHEDNLKGAEAFLASTDGLRTFSGFGVLRALNVSEDLSKVEDAFLGSEEDDD